MSKRSEKRRDYAEDVARSLRIAMTDIRRQDEWLGISMDYLAKWISLCPYDRDYVLPKARRKGKKLPKLIVR